MHLTYTIAMFIKYASRRRAAASITTLFGVCVLTTAFASHPQRAAHAGIRQAITHDGIIEYSNTAGRIQPRAETRGRFTSPYIPLIEKISREEGVDPWLVQCIVKVESDFNPDAVSVAGAMGLMQIMQDIARHYGVTDPLQPEANLRAGIKHFRALMDYFANDAMLAVAAYHAGLGRVKKNMSVPPIKSTVDYVSSVMRYYRGKNGTDAVEVKVRRLYQRIQNDGTIEIYGK